MRWITGPTLLAEAYPQDKEQIDALRPQFGQDPEAIKRLVDGMVTPKDAKWRKDAAASRDPAGGRRGADQKLPNEQLIPGREGPNRTMEVARRTRETDEDAKNEESRH